MSRRAHGEGSIYQRKDGRWAASFRYEDPDTGEGKRASVYGRTKSEARDKLKAAIARIEAGGPVRDSGRTVAEWLKDWRETALEASSRADTTKELYRALSKKHIDPAPFGTIPLERLRPSHIDKLILTLRDKGLAASTIRQIYGIVRQALADAKRDGLVARNVAEAVKRPAVPSKEVRHLSRDELRRLLSASEGSRYHTLLVFIAATGVRKGEALSTRWTDIDLEAGVYRVPGTKSERSRRRLPLAPAIVAMLEMHRGLQAMERNEAGNKWEEHGLVFCTEFGTPVHPRNALRALTVAAKDAGIEKVNVHTLRHSAATIWAESGYHVKQVADLLGHSDVAITANVYTHGNDETARDAMTTISDALGL